MALICYVICGISQIAWSEGIEEELNPCKEVINAGEGDEGNNEVEKKKKIQIEERNNKKTEWTATLKKVAVKGKKRDRGRIYEKRDEKKQWNMCGER